MDGILSIGRAIHRITYDDVAKGSGEGNLVVRNGGGCHKLKAVAIVWDVDRGLADGESGLGRNGYTGKTRSIAGCEGLSVECTERGRQAFAGACNLYINGPRTAHAKQCAQEK